MIATSRLVAFFVYREWVPSSILRAWLDQPYPVSIWRLSVNIGLLKVRKAMDYRTRLSRAVFVSHHGK